MPKREMQPSKPEGWRSSHANKKGSVRSERQEAKRRPGGRPGRNSGRRWDEEDDFKLGKRGDGSEFSVDLKETDSASYRMFWPQLVAGVGHAAKRGKNFSLQVKFYDADRVRADFTVLQTSVFDEMRSVYEEWIKERQE